MTPTPADPVELVEDEDLLVDDEGVPIEDDRPAPEGAGPAAGPEDVRPDDIDPEAVVDET